MAGFLGYALAGAASGFGQGIVEQAKALREERLAALEHNRLTQREQADRDFRSSEAQKQRDFEAGQIRTKLSAEQTAEAAKPPEVKEFFDQAGQPYKAEWDPKTRSWTKVGGSKASDDGTSLTVNPDGTVNFSSGGKKLTEAQSKDVGFYTRGIDADKTLSTLDTELLDWGQANADRIPLGLGNYLKSPEFRQAKQAADSFLTAILRKDTGAAITKQEFELYGPMFLPVPGDDKATIDQKRRARQVAMLAIRSGLGTAEAVGEANRLVLGIEDDPASSLKQDRPAKQKSPSKATEGGWVDLGDGLRVRKLD